MRPVPKPRHATAVALFVMLAILSGFYARTEHLLSTEQVEAAAGALRSYDSSLFQGDPIYGSTGLYRLESPVVRWYLREWYRVRGTEDLALPFAAPAGPLVLVYLLGMYGLMWTQTRSWSTACYVAVLSLAVVQMAGGGHWGLGTLQTMTGAAVVTALAPATLWALLNLRRSPGTLWLFLGVGLLASFDAAASLNLALVLIVALFWNGRATPRAALLGGACLLCWLAGASPRIAHLYAVHQSIGQVPLLQADLSMQTRMAESFGSILSTALEFPAFAYLLGLLIPVLALLLGSERFRIPRKRMWVALLIGTTAPVLALHALEIALKAQDGVYAGSLDYASALRWTFLPLYVLLAQAIVIARRLGLPATAMRLVLAGWMVVWLAPAENLDAVRHAMEEAAAAPLAPATRPQAVQQRQTQRQRLDELQAIGQWLRRHSAQDARVMSEHCRLRLWSLRAQLVCQGDEIFYARLGDEAWAAWKSLNDQQQRLLRPPTGAGVNLQAAIAFANRHACDYVVVPGSATTDATQRGSWVTPPDAAWGMHWKLLKVARAEPAAYQGQELHPEVAYRAE